MTLEEHEKGNERKYNMYCYFCGSELDKDEKYCLECGTAKELTEILIKEEAEKRGTKVEEIIRETEEEKRRQEAEEKRRQEAKAATEKIKKEAEVRERQYEETKEFLGSEEGFFATLCFFPISSSIACSTTSFLSDVQEGIAKILQTQLELNTYISAMSDEELEASLIKFNLLEEELQNKDNYSK